MDNMCGGSYGGSRQGSFKNFLKYLNNLWTLNPNAQKNAFERHKHKLLN
jgi:hypothetical protein